MKIKIKLFYILAAVMVLAGVASCQKDKDHEELSNMRRAGVWNPDVKISKVYCHEPSSENLYLEEEWIWDDNKLKELRFWRSYLTYTYQDDRLYRADEYDGDKLVSSWVYYYDRTSLSKIEWFANGALAGIYEFDYEVGKISSIRSETYVKRGGQFVYSFTWEGENIISCKCFRQFNGSEPVTRTYDFTYDSYNNPFYGAFEFYFPTMIVGLVDSPLLLSKNNIVKMNNSVGNNSVYSDKYNDKGYPVIKYRGDSSPLYSYEYLGD